MRETFTAALLVAGFGAVGAVARWGVSSLVTHWLGDRIAYGTLAVNVIGCLALGVVMELWLLGSLNERMRLMLATGLLGAFTTYSTFGLETFRFIESAAWHKAAANVAANLFIGLAAVWLGVMLVRWLTTS